jgi:undecaprenyl-phosphate 4-deoxy-4-formamido-L-arabinose transferase
LESASDAVQVVSIVVPVYRGEHTLKPLLAEIAPLVSEQSSPGGRRWRVGEVLLVHDCGPDASDVVIEKLAREHPFVVPIWLSRNFGQHPATLAGMASSSCDWVATVDEDGQHAPGEIGRLLDCAFKTGVSLVYAQGKNPPPHGFVRNRASALTKWVVRRLLGLSHIGRFSSFRLIAGDVARSLAAYCGHDVYLDVALSWLVDRSEGCSVELRSEGRDRSGYTAEKLLSHFGRLLVSAGTRPLRLISLLGLFAFLLSVGIAVWAVWQRLANLVPVQGWTSTVVVICFFSACILFALGAVVEYVALALSMAMGRPVYLVLSRPSRRRPR